MADYFSPYFDPGMPPTDLGPVTNMGFPADEPLSVKLRRMFAGDKLPVPTRYEYEAPFTPAAPAPSAPARAMPAPVLQPGGAIPPPSPPDPRIWALLGGNLATQFTNQEPIRPFGPQGPSLQDLRLNLVGDRNVPPIPGTPAPALVPPMENGQIPGYPTITPTNPAPVVPAPAAGAQPAVSPTAAPAAARPPAGLGARTMGLAESFRGNPLFSTAAPASVKPDFYDNLIRFGAAAMAAGGKPGATTLGALGEAGTSTFDALQKARQADIENALAGRKVGLQGQTLIIKAHELVDTLEQRSTDRAIGVAAQMQSAQDSRELKAVIASGNQALIQQKIDEIATHNRELAAGREATLAETARRDRQAETDRAAAQTTKDQQAVETRNRDAANAYKDAMTGMEKDTETSMLSYEQKRFRATKAAADLHPESNLPARYNEQAAQILAKAKADLAKGEAPDKIRKRLQGYGIGQ